MIEVIKGVLKMSKIRFGMNREGDFVQKKTKIEFFQDLYRF
jgi:hypothetical protein